VQGRARLSRTLRDPRLLPAEFAGQGRPRREVAQPAGHAGAALWISSGADAGLAGRRDARLAVGCRRGGGRADRDAGDGLAAGYRPDRRASSGPAADDRSPGRSGRHHHAEGRRGDGAHTGAHQAGAAPERRGQGYGRAGLFQRTVPVHHHAHAPAPDLRRLPAGAHVLGHCHHEDPVLVAAMRADVRRGVTLGARARQAPRPGRGRGRLVGLEVVIGSARCRPAGGWGSAGRGAPPEGGSDMTQAPQLRPLGTALGTEVLGIDLSKPLEAGTFKEIQAAFAEHPVLVFRDQDLGAPELAAFGRRFGAPRPHALTKYRHVDCPEVSWLTNVEETGEIDWYGVKRATDWHTDSTFEDALPLLAILHPKEVPSEKGGTMFADMRAAYDALPQPRKQLLSGLTGLHGRTTGPAGDRLYGDDKGATDKKYQEVQWPAVTQHPVSGRSILFVNPMHTHG